VSQWQATKIVSPSGTPAPYEHDLTPGNDGSAVSSTEILAPNFGTEPHKWRDWRKEDANTASNGWEFVDPAVKDQTALKSIENEMQDITQRLKDLHTMVTGLNASAIRGEYIKFLAEFTEGVGSVRDLDNKLSELASRVQTTIMSAELIEEEKQITNMQKRLESERADLEAERQDGIVDLKSQQKGSIVGLRAKLEPQREGGNVKKARNAVAQEFQLCLSGSVGFWITLGMLGAWSQRNLQTSTSST
jgi:hypothetical protein